MSLAPQTFAVLLPTAYLLAAGLYAMDFGGPRAPRVVGLRRAALAVACLLHAGFFAERWSAAGGAPHVELWTSVSAIALCAVLLFLLVSWNVDQKGIGAVVLGAVFLLQLAASACVPLAPRAEPLGAAAFLHASTSVLASSAVVLSGLLGGVYLLMYRQMRRRSFGPLFQHLPDLATLANLTRRSALGGFVLLGLGLNLGIAWAHAEGLGTFSYADPYVLIIMLLWVHFGLVAFSRRIPGLTAWRAALAAAAGFAILVLAFLLTLTSATFHFQG